MQYKTITLELLKQYPAVYDPLVANNTLLSTMEQQATQLRDLHLGLFDQLRQLQPDAPTIRLWSEAMEIAVKQLEDSLRDMLVMIDHRNLISETA